ncbi:IS701 family transposase [Streptomyces sp. R35]|uniref:IS701 family transposase n=1 Tax=Streptomyces sp. R35 TaxID=3238630 RepID=A0AB39SIZ2_9ACTN
MSLNADLNATRERGRGDGLSEYCAYLFSPFARSDQRRWGEVYVRGLLDASGRKTPARISEHVLGRRASQSLQQFVSQSPWEVTDVRKRLAEQVFLAAEPDAWVVDEVVFPKNGNHSAGVARQFVPAEGRTANCQLGLAVSLATEDASIPVNWRLLMPPHWDDDERRRGAARVPDVERHQPRWRHVLHSLDEMVQEWDLRPAPILADWRHEPDVLPLLDGLEARGLGYLVEVAGGAPLLAAPSANGSPVVLGTAADMMHTAGRRSARVTLAWREGVESRVRQSQFLAAQIPAGPGGPAVRHGERRFRRPRQLLVEWPAGRPQPRTYWVTNLGSRRLPDLVSTAKLRWRSRYDLGRLREECGLVDFEGRSFRGWHHHVTLASAAHGFQALERLAARRAAGAIRRHGAVPAVPVVSSVSS